MLNGTAGEQSSAVFLTKKGQKNGSRKAFLYNKIVCIAHHNAQTEKECPDRIILTHSINRTRQTQFPLIQAFTANNHAKTVLFFHCKMQFCPRNDKETNRN
ncbi:hypothetical protein DQ356_06385 [Chryseobacterium lacus]|uniref:Uncharacterized protein n=1 Tax=Chryseobacterium lacus TaxID=2058346 RepID=A0A368N0F5_9FLAO|nr:hypothetical protein DQ356_06385 [Chryseobacterium lacus]